MTGRLAARLRVCVNARNVENEMSNGLVWHCCKSVPETNQRANGAGSTTVLYSVLQSSHLGLWRHYELDFSCMAHMNLDSGRIRAARFFPGSANATLALDDGTLALEDGKRKRSSEEKGNTMDRIAVTPTLKISTILNSKISVNSKRLS